ncbi:MAG: thioredoxin-dependent thiol peroxidase [Candidatus Jidaibacter sp.]|jgi:peroxiredoxin Q/BCP|nr:thioredoxin-dependent thiol peroxidase [Candidatus Jidaibacter sp.]
MANTKVKIGELAPEFKLPIHSGGEATLKTFAGKNLVLYFYPKDATPGCTLEARDFSNNLAEFTKLNAVVLGISKDSIESHCKFADKEDLSILLASDIDGKVCEEYEVWVEKSMYGKKYMGIDRATFLIDEAGKLRNIWRGVKVAGHTQEVLKELQSLSKQ